MPALPSPSAALMLLGLLAAGGAALVSCRRGDEAAPATLTTGAAAPAVPPALDYVPMAIGAPLAEFGRPLVTNVQIVDLDRDGLPDVLYCEAQKNTVRWIRQAPRGVFTEQIIATDIPAPAHVWTGDVNATGRLDVLVASMGQLTPNNDRIGAVVVLENIDDRRFQPRVLIDRIARVTDVRGANLAGHADALRQNHDRRTFPGDSPEPVRPAGLTPRPALSPENGRAPLTFAWS